MTDLKEPVLYQKEENITWITFNRPEALNALNTDVNLALTDCLNRAEADPEVRVVILKGSGDRAFVAGADIKEMMSMSAMEARAYALKSKLVTDRIWNLKKPVILFGRESLMSCRWPCFSWTGSTRSLAGIFNPSRKMPSPFLSATIGRVMCEN
ncbi:MAG: enoyl-CoA hydratase/isomerase family protein [Syntrophobacteraceae bacterium]